MPTYQYACTECGHAFEQHQDFSDDTLTVCPECAGRLRKVYNAVGVVFKGSGFYRNDSRPTASATGSSSSSDSPSTSTTEKSSTPEKKTESSGTKSEKKASTSTGSTSAGSTSAA